MPFGLTNAPAVFQALVNYVLRDMLNRFVFVYVDDMQIFSRSTQENVLHVCQVLQRFLANQLVLKAEKCEFHRSTIPLLGYIIFAGSVQMDPGKMRVVVDWPQPTSKVQLQPFLGFANLYGCFFQGYSTLASPLSALTSPKVPFTWSPGSDQAFFDLKHKFTITPIIIHPDPSRQFVVEVDTSHIGVGAVLSQHSAQDQKLHPCAFLSHRLNPTERN